MAYGLVDYNKFQSSNPADQNAMALAAGYTGKEDYLNNRSSTQQSSSNYSYSTPSTSFNATPTFNSDEMNKAITNAVSQYKTAIQPAVDTLKSQVDPLKSRYSDLLKSIKGEQQVAENKQTTITSNELGKRGILGSSTLAQQEIQKSLQPVSAQYNSLYANTGLAQEQNINAIAQAIAQLQSGAGMQGVSTGTNTYTTALNSAAQQAAAAAQADQQRIANEIAKAQLENQTKQTNYEINKPYSTTDTGPDLSWLAGLLGGDIGGNKTSSGGWVNSKGQSWTDTNKFPVGTFTGKDGKTYTQYSDGSVGSTLWSYKV